MRVTTSCSGRFHVFDQARQLHRHGVLYRFINDYPRWMTRRWGIPNDRVIALVINGMLGRMTRWIPESRMPAFKNRVAMLVHEAFSRRLAAHLPVNSDVFIGLSSFCLPALERAKACGQLTVVDHGSLHQRYERRLLEEECRLHGLSGEGEVPPEWIIEKENREFTTADRVMVLSQVARKSLIEHGVSDEKIFVNPCGVELSQFFPVDVPLDGVFRIIYCGNISLRKGVHYLLQAFADLDIGNAELWLIGAAPNPTLNRLLAKYRSDKVRFLGTYSQSELRRIYSMGSVFVLPSLADGFGMVVPQAMACGLPVIVTENVGAADIVRDGRSGFIVPVRDVEALCEKLRFLHENRDLAREMGRQARQDVICGYTWDDYGDRLVGFLETLLRQ
ncbi:MAG: glycosyltransferase family 4 protein [Rhodocyclaceae bacterium]|nr:glycosyltransferase family 4 protein [Rhodocyclaceae bacterium]